MSNNGILDRSLSKSQIAILRTDPYSGVLIRSPMYSVLIDPTRFDAENLLIPDVILITHEHSHHLDENLISSVFKMARERAEKKEAKSYGLQDLFDLPIVVADEASSMFLKRFLPRENLKAMKPGDEASVEMLTIKAFRSNHPSAKSPLTYVVVFENGMKLYHASDSLPFEEMRVIGETERPDIAFIATGLDAGLSTKSAFDIGQMVNPKLAVPLHGKDLGKFATAIKTKMKGARVMILEPGEIGIYE